MTFKENSPYLLTEEHNILVNDLLASMPDKTPNEILNEMILLIRLSMTGAMLSIDDNDPIFSIIKQETPHFYIILKTIVTRYRYTLK